MAKRGRPADLERRRRAAELRAQGLTLREVGWRLGITKQAADQLLRPLSGYATSSCISCGKPALNDRPAPRCVACRAADPAASFAERLRALRLAAGLTQAGLAARAGVSEATVSDYECGPRRPRPRRLAALARVLGPSLQDPAGAGGGRAP
jgi:transcriptional regulator with XRE-family HTH domain